jgi:hypothetical protein
LWTSLLPTRGSGNYKGLRSRNRLQSGVGLRLVKERQENGNELDRLFSVANVIDSLDFRRDVLFPDPFGSVDSFVIGQWTAQSTLYFEDMQHWHLSDSWIIAWISQFQPDYFPAPGVATSILPSNLVHHNDSANKPVYGTIVATTVAHVLDLKLNYYHVAQRFGVFYASGSGMALLDHISNSRVQLLSARSRDNRK